MPPTPPVDAPSQAPCRPLVILGAGYTGRLAYEFHRQRGGAAIVTSRAPESHLAYAADSDRCRFDLHETASWDNLLTRLRGPFAKADLLWCFPAEPLAAIRALAEQVDLAARRLVVLGSTGSYMDPATTSAVNAVPPPWVDEQSPLDTARPRVAGEEYLRCAHHAMILRASGIYGFKRNPLQWIRQGRVGASQKYVNLIHAEDLARICLTALERGVPGETYNVSDGQPRTWESICREAERRWQVHPVASPPDRGMGKRVDTRKLMAHLQVTLRYPDLFTALEAIESAEQPDRPNG